MAIEKEIRIKVDKKEADKSVKDFKGSLNDADKEADKLNASLDDVNQTSQKASKSTKGLSTAVKGVGTALKAIGIGLILALLAKLADVFSKNQRVIDFFETSTRALSIAFNDLFGYLESKLGFITDFFKQAFENPKETIKELGETIKQGLIDRFVEFLEVGTLVADAFGKLVKGKFSEAFDLFKEAGKQSIDVITGVNDSFDKGVDAITEYTSEVIAQAEAYVQLQNTAKLAAAQQARLVEQYDRQAEKLRQIRDNDLLGISERIKANEMLADVLNKQEKAMIGAANAQVAAAQAEVDLNNSIENRVTLTEALTNKEGVLAQVEGLRSEQLVNRNALLRERIELDNTISQSEQERQLKQLEFDAEIEENELQKLEAQRERLELQAEIDLAELERKRELYAEETQARVDAEQDYLSRKQEIDNALIQNNRSVQEAIVKQENEAKEKRILFEETVQDAKVNLTQNAFSLISNLLKAGSDLAKGFAIANVVREQVEGVSRIITNTAVANAKAAAASPLTLGQPFVTLNTVSAGLGIASSIAGAVKSISDITSEKKSVSGGSVGGSSGGRSTPNPSFNLVQGTGENQIASSIQQQNKAPVRAFVVGKNVTSQQELDRNIQSSAKIG